MKILTIVDMINELKEFYSLEELSKEMNISVSTINRILKNNSITREDTIRRVKLFFNEHVKNNLEEVSVKDLIDNNTHSIIIDTPDGLQYISQLIIKRKLDCRKIKTLSGELEGSHKHLVEGIDNNWIQLIDVNVGTVIKTVNGYEGVISVEETGKKQVYDLTIEHDNHRYWAGNISNHNSGKSFIAQKIVGNAQKMGMYTVVFDTENAIDARMVESLGADPKKIKYFPAKSIEQVRNAIFALLQKIEETHMEGKFLVVIDSLANMLSEMETKRMDKDSTSADMGTIAKAIKSLLKTCTTYGGLTKTTFVVTNHIYDNPNEMYPDLVKCMNGGKACRYLPSVVVQLAKKNLKEKDSGEKDEVGKGIAGIEMRCMCVKNRFIRPMIEGSMYLSWKTGLDEEYGTLELAVNLGVIERRGSVYDLYDGTSLGYAKAFRKKKELWDEKIYPEIERRLPGAWGYSAHDIPEEETEEELIEE